MEIMFVYKRNMPNIKRTDACVKLTWVCDCFYDYYNFISSRYIYFIAGGIEIISFDERMNTQYLFNVFEYKYQTASNWLWTGKHSLFQASEGVCVPAQCVIVECFNWIDIPEEEEGEKTY